MKQTEPKSVVFFFCVNSRMQYAIGICLKKNCLFPSKEIHDLRGKKNSKIKNEHFLNKYSFTCKHNYSSISVY